VKVCALLSARSSFTLSWLTCVCVCVSPPTGHLGEPVLLPLWLPVPRLHHLGGVLLSDQHRHGLFPAVCRGELTTLREEGVVSSVVDVSSRDRKLEPGGTDVPLVCSPSGLPVVVENLPGVGRLGVLRPHLRRLLLHQQGKETERRRLP